MHWVPSQDWQPLQSQCRDASASVAPGSTLSKGSMVGRGSTIETGARLDRCAVGSDCHIGRGAVLQNSCLHAHVRVDDGCQVASALLADHVVVRSHAKLEVSLLLREVHFPDAASVDPDCCPRRCAFATPLHLALAGRCCAGQACCGRHCPHSPSRHSSVTCSALPRRQHRQRRRRGVARCRCACRWRALFFAGGWCLFNKCFIARVVGVSVGEWAASLPPATTLFLTSHRILAYSWAGFASWHAGHWLALSLRVGRAMHAQQLSNS